MGIIKKFDSLGRIVIPCTMKKALGLENGDEAIVELQEKKIVITNPKRMRSKEEILKKIKHLKEATSNSYETYNGTRLVNDDLIDILKWVLND